MEHRDVEVEDQQHSVKGSDGSHTGRHTPPAKHKGKFSNFGKIFKPWKWRKKKDTSEKFKETSEVLERKISIRRTRQELIDQGLLKELPENESNDVKAPSVKNGHTLPVSGDRVPETAPEIKVRTHGDERKNLLTLEPERRIRTASDVTRNRQPLDVDARMRISSDSDKRDRDRHSQDEVRYRERRDDERREDRDRRDRREDRREDRDRRDRRDEIRDVKRDKEEPGREERRDERERRDQRERREEHDRREEPQRRDNRDKRPDSEWREEKERREERKPEPVKQLSFEKPVRPQSEMDIRSGLQKSSSEVGQRIRPASEAERRTTLPRNTQLEDDPRTRIGSVGVRFTPTPEVKEPVPLPKQAILPPKWLMSSSDSGQASPSSSSSSSVSSTSSSSAPPIAKPPPRTVSLMPVDDSLRPLSPASLEPSIRSASPVPSAPISNTLPATSDPKGGPKMPPVPPPKPTHRNSNTALHDASLSLPVPNPVPAKRSPPVPPTRMTPIAKRQSEDVSSVHIELPARSSSPNLPIPQSEDSKIPGSPVSVVFPVPTHIPPSPPRTIVDPPSPTTEPPAHPPALPLHILIQRALTSPGPLNPSPDGNRRAHSALFELPHEIMVETSVRNSLPVTLEPLRLPEDDDFDMEEELRKLNPAPRPTWPVELEPRSRLGLVGDPAVTVIPENADAEESGEESDSDGSIVYRDDDTDEEEEDVPITGLASRVKRKDTLAMKLDKQQEKEEKQGQENGHWKNQEQWEAMRNMIGTALTRRLSQRPTQQELEERNILQAKNDADRRAERSEIKRRLTRKLSQRPTVAELQKRKILRFHEYVESTFAEDFDRRGEKPWIKLTPADKAAIRRELNDFKGSEMQVHEESKIYTRFHRP
ncbi:phosphatase and actin regulator 4A isoform X2 [Trichomycterus rosablanca]|uniref:phosphatase and actin regulator 4A isoform X2 n=1 Tax=Trichomycterus rosablanca TaxID=2290929 RepID=UPI002F35FC03